jgi:hypothetical protein
MSWVVQEQFIPVKIDAVSMPCIAALEGRLDDYIGNDTISIGDDGLIGFGALLTGSHSRRRYGE